MKKKKEDSFNSLCKTQRIFCLFGFLSNFFYNRYFLFFSLELKPVEELNGGTFRWHLTNKYFEANVDLYCCSLKEFQENLSQFSNLEAVLIMFHANNVS